MWTLFGVLDSATRNKMCQAAWAMMSPSYSPGTGDVRVMCCADTVYCTVCP